MLFLLVLIAVFIIITIFDLTRYLNLAYIKSQVEIWAYQLENNLFIFSLIFFLIYVIVTSLSIPGAALLTLLAGTLFGLVGGTIIVSFASTLGATGSFLFSRYLLKDNIEKKFRASYKKINEGLLKEGPLYLFALRLVPIVPFFVINLVMGITRIRVLTYMLTSQVGMLAGTIVYVNAGRSLRELNSTAGIFTFKLWISFILLASLPFISKKILASIRKIKAYKQFKKPKKFDTNLVVIGAGSGGLISAYIAATIKAKVILIEKNKMGGDCLNTGCVPSKAILSASKYARVHLEAKKHGITLSPPKISFSSIMESVHKAIETVAPHDCIERYESLGVQCVQGEAKIISPWEVKVNDRVITTKSIIIATGGTPRIPDIQGITPSIINDYILTSDTVWSLTTLPPSLLILGGGPIGCEMALAFSSMGSEVTLVHTHSHILSKEDDEVGAFAETILQKNGVKIICNHTAIEVHKKARNIVVDVQNKEGKTQSIACNKMLCAIGRTAHLDNVLEKNIHIDTLENGSISTNKALQTNIPNIYAVGDCVGPHQFTHIASHMAWYAAVNALLGHIKTFEINYAIVPAVTFLTPEIGRVGLSEKEAKEQGIEYQVSIYHMNESDRAIAEQKTEGFIKVITAGTSDTILGAVVISERGGEILAQFILAMKNKLGLGKILGTILPYPTYAESAKSVAGVWKKKNAPDKIINLLGKYFKMMR